MEEKILMDCGLSAEQAKIYLFLLRKGNAPAKRIAVATGIGRTLVYKVLEQLATLELVEKKKNIAKVTFFFPVHPGRLKEIMEKKLQTSERALTGMNAILSGLMSEFNMLIGKPNVQFFEGVEGLKKIYDDILDTNQEIRVISSPIDEGRKEVLHLIREQIAKQAARKIQTKAINPTGNHEPATPVAEDEKYLITRKQVPTEKLNIPAQIIVYGDKVAITNFKEAIITVLVESKYIAETFRIMFEYIWEHNSHT